MEADFDNGYSLPIPLVSSSSSLTITIVNNNDNSPSFDDFQDTTIPENIIFSAQEFVTSISAKDPDEDDKITFSIQNSTGFFLIGEDNGIITTNRLVQVMK